MLFSTVTVLFGIYVCWIPQINAECQSKILNVTKNVHVLYINIHAFTTDNIHIYSFSLLFLFLVHWSFFFKENIEYWIFLNLNQDSFQHPVYMCTTFHANHFNSFNFVNSTLLECFIHQNTLIRSRCCFFSYD